MHKDPEAPAVVGKAGAEAHLLWVQVAQVHKGFLAGVQVTILPLLQQEQQWEVYTALR